MSMYEFRLLCFHLIVVWGHVFYDRKRNNQVQLFQSGLEVTCQRIFLFLLLTYAYAWWYSNVQNYDKQSSENDRFFKFTLKVTYPLRRWYFQFLPWVLAASSFQTLKKESGNASDLLLFLSEPPILSHCICLQLLLFFFFFPLKYLPCWLCVYASLSLWLACLNPGTSTGNSNTHTPWGKMDRIV